jgi:hypothetical protein
LLPPLQAAKIVRLAQMAAVKTCFFILLVFIVYSLFI